MPCFAHDSDRVDNYVDKIRRTVSDLKTERDKTMLKVGQEKQDVDKC